MQSRVVCLPRLSSSVLCMYLLSLWLCLLHIRLPQVVRSLDMYWPSLRLCALDVSRTLGACSVCTLAVCYKSAALCVGLSFYGWSVLFFAFQVVRARRVLTEFTVVCARRRLAEPRAHARCLLCRVLRLRCPVHERVVLWVVGLRFMLQSLAELNSWFCGTSEPWRMK